REGFAAVEVGFEVLAGDVLHRQDELAVADEVLPQADDARVAEPGEEGRLDEHAVEVAVDGDGLDGDEGVRPVLVMAAVDDAEGAPAELALEDVRAEGGDGGGHRRYQKDNGTRMTRISARIHADKTGIQGLRG